MLLLAASLENASEHPLATAIILCAAKHHGIDTTPPPRTPHPRAGDSDDCDADDDASDASDNDVRTLLRQNKTKSKTDKRRRQSSNDGDGWGWGTALWDWGDWGDGVDTDEDNEEPVWSREMQGVMSMQHAPYQRPSRSDWLLEPRDVEIIAGVGIKGWVRVPAPGRGYLVANAPGVGMAPVNGGGGGNGTMMLLDVQMMVGSRKLVTSAGLTVPAVCVWGGWCGGVCGCGVLGLVAWEE